MKKYLHNERNIEAHINGPWHMNKYGQPDYWWRVQKESPYPAERFAKCTFYFTEDDKFRPIVFTDVYVHSLRSWNLWRFYDGLKRCVAAYYTQGSNWCAGFLISAEGTRIKWGCRYFDIKDIVAMKQQMEKRYTSEQLSKMW